MFKTIKIHNTLHKALLYPSHHKLDAEVDLIKAQIGKREFKKQSGEFIGGCIILKMIEGERVDMENLTLYGQQLAQVALQLLKEDELRAMNAQMEKEKEVAKLADRVKK